MAGYIKVGRIEGHYHETLWRWDQTMLYICSTILLYGIPNMKDNIKNKAKHKTNKLVLYCLLMCGIMATNKPDKHS